MPATHRNHLVTLFSLSIFLLSIPNALASATSAGGGGEGIKCDCSGGSPKCTLGGQEIKADMGASTPTKNGKLPAMQACVGSSFACMKGKDCIEIEGAYKFHKTNCGSGGAEPSGSVKTAGCVVLSDADFDKLKSMQGQPFEVKGCGGGSGR